MLEQDFLNNIIDVRWPASNWLALGFQLRLFPTIEFQRPRFDPENTNFSFDELTTGPVYTGADQWPFYVTDCRFMWSTWRMHMQNYSDPAFGGSGWAVIFDDKDEAPAGFARSFSRTQRTWSGVSIPSKSEFVGYPSMPITDAASGGTIAAGTGPGATSFWPEPEWSYDGSSGSSILLDGLPVNDPSGQPFKSTMGVTFRGRGPAITASGQQDGDGHQAYIVEWGDTGFAPDGGPIAVPLVTTNEAPQLNPTGTFAEHTISFAGMQIIRTSGSPPDIITRTWNAVGVSHVPFVFTPAQLSGAPRKRPCGTVWVLMEPQVTP